MTDPAGTERAFIKLAQQGDRQAFGELVTLHQESVINVVYRMCGDPNMAEDAAQEAFVRAWKSIRSYDPGRPFRSWLYRIAINAALDANRREKPAADLESMHLVSRNGNPEATLERHEREAEVRRAILALPESSRAAFVLREYEGLSYAQISTALGIPLGTVMSRLNYARRQLRDSLATAAHLEDL